MVFLKTDPDFDIYRTKEYKLSIQVSLDGFSFSVIQQSENKLLATCYSPATVSSVNFLGRRVGEWIDSQEILKNNFSETKLLYSSDKFTLVPGVFYDYEKQNNLASFVFGKVPGFESLDNYLEEETANLVFSIPVSLTEVFQNKFPGSAIYHPVSVINRKINKLGKHLDQNIAIHFYKNCFHLLLYADGKLQIANHYRFAHPNDVVYYIVSVLKSKQLNIKNTTLLFSGEIIKESELIIILQNFFDNIEFLTPSLKLNSKIFGAQSHQFFPLC